MTEEFQRRGGEEDDATFAERIAQPLRAPETLGASFDARVMSAVEAEATRAEGRVRTRRSYTGFWLKPRRIEMSPLAMLAMAAGFAGVVALGDAAGKRFLYDGDAAISDVASSSRVDTVRLMRFVFAAPGAREVALMGDFNGWSKDATKLVATGVDGVWSVTVPLDAGRHEYAFLVRDANGERWVTDPTAQRVRDEFGTESSVVTLGGEVSSNPSAS